MTTINSSSASKKKKSFTPEDAIQMAMTLIEQNGPSAASSIIQAVFSRLSEELPPSIFPEEALSTMSQEVYNQANARIADQIESEAAEKSISPADSALISNLICENADSVAQICASVFEKTALKAPADGETTTSTSTATATEKSNIVNLMTAFTAHALGCYHHSGWIRYDRKDIFNLAQLNQLSIAEQENLIKLIHSCFGLDMRVIGSAQPIPCYKLPWLIPPTEELPITKITPSKIRSSLMRSLSLSPFLGGIKL